jgi:hypothetical protein
MLFIPRNHTHDADKYHELSGTSQACPHAAGVAALVLSILPGAAPSQVHASLLLCAKVKKPRIINNDEFVVVSFECCDHSAFRLFQSWQIRLLLQHYASQTQACRRFYNHCDVFHRQL